MLGLGGGTIAGQMLCSSSDCSLHVTAVEADADVVDAASDHFLPLMFGANPHVEPAQEANLRRRLHVARADANSFVNGSTALPAAPFGPPYDVVVEDFSYGVYGQLAPAFWRSLRMLTTDGGTLLVNTLFPHFTEMDHLARDLRTAGWSSVSMVVDRGVDDDEADVSRPQDWRPGDNMIVSAVNPGL